MSGGQLPDDAVFPLRLVPDMIGIPKASLYRWAASGRLPTRIIDGEKCATWKDIRNAARRHPRLPLDKLRL